MDMTQELVEQLARLSRLELQDGEARDMAAGLEQIAACMDVLARLDTDGVEHVSHVLPVKNVLREDEVVPSLPREELLAGVPGTDGEAFLVPRAVE